MSPATATGTTTRNSALQKKPRSTLTHGTPTQIAQARTSLQAFMASPQVHEHVEHRPEENHEEPEHPAQRDGDVSPRREPAAARGDQHQRQPDESAEHVGAMDADQGVEGGPVAPRGRREA